MMNDDPLAYKLSCCGGFGLVIFSFLQIFWSLDLLEAIQGITSSSTFFVPFAHILEYFIILWFRTSLDMILKIDKKWYDCIK